MNAMDRYVSVLMLRSAPGKLAEAIAQFEDARVLQTCRDAVPGFVSGRLLRSEDDPTSACVICEWTDRAAFEQWMSSPLRRSDRPGRLFEPSGRSALFAQIQQVDRVDAAGLVRASGPLPKG